MCDGCTVGRVWFVPVDEELDPYQPPKSPDDVQGDNVMQEQQLDMDNEWMVHHDMLQSQDNFSVARYAPAAGEGSGEA